MITNKDIKVAATNSTVDAGNRSIYSITATGSKNSEYGKDGIWSGGKLSRYFKPQKSQWYLNYLFITGDSINGSERDLFIEKLDAYGKRDASFNGNGVKVISETGSQYSSVITVTENYIYVAANSNQETLIYRLLHNASIDTTFGLKGKFRFLRSFSYDQTVKIVETADSGLVILHQYTDNYFLMKLTNKGVYDNSFGLQGKQYLFNLKPYTRITDFALSSDGGIYLLGNEKCSAALIKLTGNGGIDSSFANSGKQIFEDVQLNKILLSNQSVYLAGRFENDFLFMTGLDNVIVTENKDPVSHTESVIFSNKNGEYIFNDPGNLKVYDFTGKLVDQRRIDEKDVFYFNPGGYIIHYETNDNLLIKKIIVF